MSTMITAQYNQTIQVSFTSDAWFNATDVAKQYKKRPNDWLLLESTKEYIENLAKFYLPENLVNTKNQFVITKTGQLEHGGGTWFHPKLAIAFARWLDVGFSIWCDMQIEKILHPAIASKTLTPAQYGKLYKEIDSLAAGSGKIRKQLFTALYHRYAIASYKDLPSDKLDEAIGYLKATYDYDTHEYLSWREMESFVKWRIENPDTHMPKYYPGNALLYITEEQLKAKIDDGLKTANSGKLVLTKQDANSFIKTYFTRNVPVNLPATNILLDLQPWADCLLNKLSEQFLVA